MSKYSNPDQQGWHPNTEFSCDLKTILSSDTRMKTSKSYQGVLRRDSDTVAEEFLYRDPHYTFVETLPAASFKRNPQVFNGKYVTLTRRDDGTYRPNFKPIRIGPKFNAVSFAVNVSNELLWALEGLVEEV